MKQYLPSKPNKWGYKLFILCGVSDFSYDFKVYTGQENNAMHRLPHKPDLGASGNIVVWLRCKIPRNVNHKLFFDNYYTSVELLAHLSKQGIPVLGTVRGNRIPYYKVITDEEICR